MNMPQATGTADATDAASLGFVLDQFVISTDGAIFAQTVSADGMHLAASSQFDRPHHDTFAAIASGLASLGTPEDTVEFAMEFSRTDSGGWRGSSTAVGATVAQITRTLASRLAWVRTTPLGSPVLPEVYCR